MEQTGQKRTAKILLSTVLTFVVTLAMVFAILPQATLTAYAAGGTEVTQANVICQQYSYMDAGDYSGGSMYDTPPVEITNITLADAQAFGAAVTCPTTYWVVVYAKDGNNLKWTSNGKTGEQTSTPNSSMSAWCELYNNDVFSLGDPYSNVTFYFSKGLATPAETLLTTITATGQEQASYSVENIATVSFSYTAQGSSAYYNNGKTNWGWWGYGWIATVSPVDGYTITKCVFYDDKDRTATDSEAPFVVETTEEDKTPQVNGTPILAYQSKGITKIEVYGYATLVKKDVTSISLNKNTTTILIGNNETLTATVSPNDATYKTVVWLSDNTNVAEVDSNGKITAKSVGSANITARATNGTDDTSDDFTATCVVTVNAINVTGVNLNKNTTTILVGNNETLTATISPNNATYKTLIWSSNNTNVAEVNSNGKVTAKSAGTAIITARATNGTDDTSDDFTASCVVTVHAHNYTVTVNGSTATVKCSNDCPDYKEYTVSLNATDKDYDGTTNVATITKSNDLPNTILVGTINYVGRDGTTYNSATAPTNVGKYSASVTVGDKTITKNFEIKALAPVSFISSVTYNPSKNTVTIVVTTIRQYIILTSTTTIWQNNYYIAKNDVTINGPVYYGANVCLILFDDVTLSIRGGLKRYGSELVIYGQEGQTGLFEIQGADNDYVIDGDNITVNGGRLNLITGTDGTLFSDNSSITFNGAVNLTATNSQGEELVLESGKTYTGSELNSYNSFETTTKLATLTDVNVYQTGTLTYNGEPQIAEVFASATAQNEQQVVFTYSASENETYTTEVPAFTNAGTYTVYFKANAENHEEATGSFVVTIGKADIVLTTPTAIQNLVYTGNTQALVAAGTAEGGEMQYALGENATTAPADNLYATSIPTATNAGTYYVWYKIAGDENHNDTEPACVEVTINKADPTYAIPSGLTATYGDTLADVALPDGWAWTNGAQSVGNVGSNTFTANFTPADTANYNTVSNVNVTVTVGKKAASVTANNKSKTYGEADPALTATVEGTVGTDIINYTLSRAEGNNVGEYAITVTLGENPNYEVAITNAKLTVGKKAATVTANNKAKTYGEADPALTATVEGTVGTDIINYTLSRAEGNNVGKYAITVTLGENPNYDVTTTNAKLTIGKKSASVTANNKTKTYGEADPALTATVEGTVGTDIINYTLSRAEGNNVGEYAITVTLGENPNYEVAVTGAKLTIGKKAATVAAANKSKTYGEADPALTATVEGVVGTDIINYTLSRAEGNNVGEYAITVTLGENPNYEVTATNGSFTINKKTVTVKADNRSKTYGDADPALTYTASGLVGGDTLTGSLARAAGENAGTYAITQGTLAVGANYSLSFTGATLTIGAKSVKIVANDQKKDVETADPKLTYTVEGLLAGDTLTGSLARAEGEAVGIYAITLGTLTAGNNYVVDFTGATLTICATHVETDVNIDENAPEMNVEGINEDVANAILTEEEKRAIDEGKEVKVYLEIIAVDEKTVPTGDKTEIEKEAETSGMKVGMYLDLSLLKQIGESEAIAVHDTDGNMIKVTITVPEELRSTNPSIKRTFYVVRVHNGETTVLGASTEDTVSFETDKFSTYSLMYKDVSFIWLWILIIAVVIIAACVTVIIVVKKKKKTTK